MFGLWGRMRVGVAGITGRMGRLVVQAVGPAGAELAGGLAGRAGSASALPDAGTQMFVSAAALAQDSDALIDFTHPGTIGIHAAAVAAGKCAWVLGTTGLSAEDEDIVRGTAQRVPVVYSANFSPGVALVLALAERLARALPADEYDAEIVETHHRHKVDAPSGTALALARVIAGGRHAAWPDAVRPAGHGQVGPRPPGSVGIASLRGGQVVGEHTILFAGDGEHVSLTHKALDRSVFARGAVRAALWAGRGRQPGLYSMADVLGMTHSPGMAESQEVASR